MAYKLLQYAGVVRRTKFSCDKVIYPGCKEVFRRVEDGTFAGGMLGEPGEGLAAEPLLVPVMKDGRCIIGYDAGLEAARAHARQQVNARPAQLHSLEDARWFYPVAVSAGVTTELKTLRPQQRLITEGYR